VSSAGQVGGANARTAIDTPLGAERLRGQPFPARAEAVVDFGRLAVVAIILVVSICYLVSLTPGHGFVNDDFAAYIMHAQNLIEGRAYSAIRYIPNPDAMWLSPATGYPPIYPLILAPVYRIFGLDLQALKIATVLCFLGFLVIYEALTRPELGRAGGAIALLLLSFSPVFWDQRDQILSEFPYLLFSFAALLAIARVYARADRNRFEIGDALLVSVLIYCAYGTRTIGMALVVALIAADLIKFRRPSRFLLGVLALTGALIGAQTLLLASPEGYVSAFHFSPHTIAVNAVYYGKTLSYCWANGFSKQVQIVVALLFTVAAAWGFLKSLRRDRGAKEFYLLVYVAVLVAWNSEIGLRGLLPILPLYFFYGLRECIRLFETARLPVRVIAMAALVVAAAVSYAGEIRYEASLPAGPNVANADAVKMFEFVRENTGPEDVLVFSKPRTLALFGDRTVAALSPEQTETQSLAFLRAIHATVVIDSDWSAVKAHDEVAALEPQEIFRVGAYRVYRIHSAEDRTQALNGK
jgi:hypothetical protein